MSVEISFCPLCAGKLDSGKKDRFVCDDCETHFLIQVDDEADDDEDEEEKEEDENDEDEEEDEEVGEEDEY
jgi:hypothetical protein